MKKCLLLLTLVNGILESPVSSSVYAQTPPSTYSAYTGTDTKIIPPAPVLGSANSVINDPTFGSRILRVTDPNTNSGESFISTDAGFHRTWNANSTAIKLTGPHGDGYWLEFNPIAFVVGDGSSRPAIHSLPFAATWEWSAIDPDIIYFLNGNQIGKYNKATRVTTNLGGPPNGDPITYMAVVIGQDNWVCAAAGAGAQDSYTEIFCVNPITPSVNKFIDVINKTVNGVISTDPNWPTSASGQTIGIHDISGGTGASWLEVTFHGQSWGANGGAVLNLGTNTWSEVTNGDLYWSGHVSMGNGKYANSAGSIDGRDSRGLLLRNPDNLMSSSDYRFIGQPPSTLNGWCDADHSSWFNSTNNSNAPILASRYTIVTPCQYAWAGEIVAAAVDGSNIVWRFAHNHDGGNVCYYAEAFAQISNDGHWALFSSYWDGSLGPDTSFGCSTRIDTFIVDLLGGGGSSDVSTLLSITNRSLANGTQGISYTAQLSAVDGVAPYSWSIVSGTLPVGLTLSSSGVISGTPTGNGTSIFTVQVTDAKAQKTTAVLSLTINAASSSSPITLIQSAQVEGSAVGSMSVGFPSNNNAGNLIIAFVRMSTTYQTVAVADTMGNVYSDAVAQFQTYDGHLIHIFYAKNIRGGANRVTATFSATNSHPWLAVYEYSGLDSTNPLDLTAQAQNLGSVPGSVASASTASVSSTTNQLVFAAVGLPSSYAGAVIAGTSYVLREQDTGTSRAANETTSLSSQQTVSAAFTLSSPTYWSLVLATFKAAGASTSTVPAPSIITTTLPAGSVNTPYSASLSATGGTSPYTWSVVSGSLPSGLNLGSTSGVISGIPTGAGSSTFTVQVVDANLQKATATLNVLVNSTPIQLVQSSAVEGSGVGSVSASFGGNNRAGNLILAFVRMSTTTQTVIVSDSMGNVYTEAVAQASQTADGHQVHIFYAKNIVGGANRVTANFSSSNNRPWLAIYEYSGLSTTNPLDQTAHAQASSSVANSGMTSTTSSAKELVFAAAGLPGTYSGAVTAGTGYIMQRQDTGSSRAATASAIVSSTGSYAAIFALDASVNWTAVVATFRQ